MTSRRHPVMGAALWMTGALASFMAMAIGGREAASELNTFQILFFRSAIGLLVVCVLVARSGRAHFRTRQPMLQVIRNVAHLGGQYGWFYGIALLSLAEVFAIEFTVPVWTAILATLLLGERLTRARLAAVGLGLAGMLIILRPGLAVFNPVSLAVLGGAIGYAVTHTLTRKLAMTDTPLTILFYMTVIQLPLALLPSIDGWVTPSVYVWPWLAALGVTALSAHYCLARALSLAEATVVVPMDFLRLPLIALVGFVFYDEPLDGFVLSGALIMLAGNTVNIRAERRKHDG